jgi:hypothetical protein
VAVSRLTSPMRKRLFSETSIAGWAALAMAFLYPRPISCGVNPQGFAFPKDSRAARRSSLGFRIYAMEKDRNPSYLSAGSARCVPAERCSGTPAAETNLDLGSTKSVICPDQQWKFVSIATKSPDQNAIYTSRTHIALRSGTSVRWNATERCFGARAARERFFEILTQLMTQESGPLISPVQRQEKLRGLDRAIRQAIFARIPKNETTLWLYYRKACFSADDSSTILVSANLPLALKNEDSKGKSFGLTLTINLTLLRLWSRDLRLQPFGDPSRAYPRPNRLPNRRHC